MAGTMLLLPLVSPSRVSMGCGMAPRSSSILSSFAPAGSGTIRRRVGQRGAWNLRPNPNHEAVVVAAVEVANDDDEHIKCWVQALLMALV
eukprot:scaffold32325_cov26-Tisochrysis_lutea.AAC.2